MLAGAYWCFGSAISSSGASACQMSRGTPSYVTNTERTKTCSEFQRSTEISLVYYHESWVVVHRSRKSSWEVKRQMRTMNPLSYEERRAVLVKLFLQCSRYAVVSFQHGSRVLAISEQLSTPHRSVFEAVKQTLQDLIVNEKPKICAIVGADCAAHVVFTCAARLVPLAS